MKFHRNSLIRFTIYIFGGEFVSLVASTRSELISKRKKKTTISRNRIPLSFLSIFTEMIWSYCKYKYRIFFSFHFKLHFILQIECNCMNEKKKDVAFFRGIWCNEKRSGKATARENVKENSQPISDESTAVRNIVYKAASRWIKWKCITKYEEIRLVSVRLLIVIIKW